MSSSAWRLYCAVCTAEEYIDMDRKVDPFFAIEHVAKQYTVDAGDVALHLWAKAIGVSRARAELAAMAGADDELRELGEAAVSRSPRRNQRSGT